MAEERRGSHDSVELVYGIARAAYRDQFSQRDQQRTRCGALLAFAGILATLSISAARDAHGSLLIFETTPRVRQLADQHLLSSPRDTELQILGITVGVIHRNERSLQRADSVFGLAVLLLFLGTLRRSTSRRSAPRRPSLEDRQVPGRVPATQVGRAGGSVAHPRLPAGGPRCLRLRA